MVLTGKRVTIRMIYSLRWTFRKWNIVRKRVIKLLI